MGAIWMKLRAAANVAMVQPRIIRSMLVIGYKTGQVYFVANTRHPSGCFMRDRERTAAVGATRGEGPAGSSPRYGREASMDETSTAIGMETRAIRDDPGAGVAGPAASPCRRSAATDTGAEVLLALAGEGRRSDDLLRRLSESGHVRRKRLRNRDAPQP